jgi:hypothetical protein
MDDTSFDLLCRGLTTAESKLFRKILKEWCNGEEDSFPVQLALLTKVQWLAAAEMPLILQKAIVTFEAKLAEHHKQQTALIKVLGNAGDEKIKAFEKTVVVYTEAMEKVAAKSCDHLVETEKFAREIRNQMELGLRESDRITETFTDERHRLEEARRDYERSTEWRETANTILALIIAFVSGALAAWYFCRH